MAVAGGAGVAAAAAGAAGTMAAEALAKEKRCVEARAALGPPTAGASGRGVSTPAGVGGYTLGRNRSPPLVLTMLLEKEGKKGWREKLGKLETGSGMGWKWKKRRGLYRGKGGGGGGGVGGKIWSINGSKLN